MGVAVTHPGVKNTGNTGTHVGNLWSTSGQRLACVGWVQSLIRRDDQRELLFDLSRVRGAMAAYVQAVKDGSFPDNALHAW